MLLQQPACFPGDTTRFHVVGICRALTSPEALSPSSLPQPCGGHRTLFGRSDKLWTWLKSPSQEVAKLSPESHPGARIHTHWTYYNWGELHLLIKLICFSVRVEINIASKLRILKYFLDMLLSVWRHHYRQEGNTGDLRHKEDPTFKEIMGI